MAITSISTPGTRPIAGLGIFILLLALYLAALLLGNLFYLDPDNLAMFWPASGILLCALVLSEYRHWTMVILGTVVAQYIADIMIFDYPTSLFAFFTVANMVEAMFGALLLRRFVGHSIDMGKLKDVLGLLVLAGVGASAIGAAIATTGIVLTHPETVFLSTWQVWWFAEAVGVIVVAPAILAILGNRKAAPLRARKLYPIELGALFILLIGAGQLALGSSNHLMQDFPYLLYPLLIWALIRFEPEVAAVAALVITLLTVWNVQQGQGPFTSHAYSPHYQVLVMQAFVVFTVAGMALLSAMITQQRRTSIELNKATNARRVAMESIHQRYWRYDKDLRLEVWNSGSEGYTSASGLERVGHPLLEELEYWAKQGWHGPGDPKEIAQARYRQYQDGSIPRFEHRTTPEGNLLEIRRYRTPDGGYTETQADVTEQRKLEKRVRDNEALFGAFLANSPNQITIKDLQRRYTHMSHGFLQLFDLTEDQILGKRPEEVLPGQVAENINNGDRHVLESGKVWRTEGKFENEHGSKTFVVVRFPVIGPGGELIALGGISTDITEIRQQQIALLKSEERFRNLTEGSLQGIAVFDSDWTIEFANQALADVLGYSTPAKMIGNNWSSCIPDQELARMREYRQLRLNGDPAPSQYETELLKLDGSVVHVLIGVRMIEWNQHTAFQYIVFDITDQKKTEIELRESNARFRAYMDNTPDVIVVRDSAGKYRYVNRQFEKTYDISFEETIGRLSSPAHTDAEIKIILEEVTRVQNNRKAHKRYQVSLAEGQKRHWLVTRFPIITADGELVGTGGISTDITDLRQSEQALMESEKRYRRLFEMAPVSLAEQDWSEIKQLVDNLRAQGVDDVSAHLSDHPELIGGNGKVPKLLDVNREALRIYGVSDKQDFLNNLPSKLWPAGDPLLIQRISTFISGQHRCTLEATSRRRDGTLFPVRITTENVGENPEDWSLIYTSDNDITEEKRINDRLRVYQAQLRELAGQISLAEEHERRRITAGIHDGTIQNLIAAKLKLAALKKALRSKRSTTLVAEINQLLTSSLNETRSMIFELCPPVLYELGLKAAIVWLSDQFRQRTGITAKFDSDGKVIELSQELEIVLFQAVRELLTNVAKHAHAKKVLIEWVQDRNRFELRVQDDGKGFEYSETRSGISSSGGFGLFSLRERLSLLGADLTVDSSSAGTLVTIAVPIATGVAQGK